MPHGLLGSLIKSIKRQDLFSKQPTIYLGIAVTFLCFNMLRKCFQIINALLSNNLVIKLPCNGASFPGLRTGRQQHVRYHNGLSLKADH